MKFTRLQIIASFIPSKSGKSMILVQAGVMFIMSLALFNMVKDNTFKAVEFIKDGGKITLASGTEMETAKILADKLEESELEQLKYKAQCSELQQRINAAEKALGI
jgi:hypothetical protein